MIARTTSLSLAVAEKFTDLAKFLKSVKRRKRDINTAVNSQSPADSGKKKKSTQVRRGRARISSQPTFSASPLQNVKYPDPDVGAFLVAAHILCHGNTRICYTCRYPLDEIKRHHNPDTLGIIVASKTSSCG